MRPIAIGNTLRRIASRCAGSERHNIFGSFQIGCVTKGGAEIALHSFRILIERDDNPKRSILLKLDFSNVFTSLNRETMLIQSFSDRPELYSYTHFAYSKPSFLFNGNFLIKSEDGTKQVMPWLHQLLLKRYRS